MKKILFYSHIYKPETGAAAVRANYFVKALREAGHEVKVIAPKPNYPLGKVFDGFESPSIIHNKKEDITYLPIFCGSHSAYGRLLSYISYFFSSLLYMLFNSYKPDIVITSTPPIFTAYAASIYSNIKGSKFILDIRDIWPDIGIELGILNSNFYINGLKWIEKRILKRAYSIIVTAKGDKENILSKIGASKNCEIIYNGADTEIFKPLEDEEIAFVKLKYDIPPEKKIIIYFGSLNNGMNDIDILGDFLSDPELKNKNCHFISVGTGDNLKSLLNKIKDNISYTSIESLPMEEVAKVLASSDISIIPRKGIKKDTGGNIPVKCYESWSAGVPVLLSNIKDAEIVEIFNRCKSGVLVEPDNKEELIKGLTRLLSLDIADMRENGRKFVEENFDRKKQSAKLVSIIQNLCKNCYFF